jgi:hypothetical protein
MKSVQSAEQIACQPGETPGYRGFGSCERHLGRQVVAASGKPLPRWRQWQRRDLPGDFRVWIGRVATLALCNLPNRRPLATAG